MRLLTKPESDSYTLTFPKEALMQDLDGGRGRYRKDILNGSVRLKPTWILDPTDYNYFMAFYRQQSQSAAEPFTMMLIVEKTTEVECTCNMIPGSLELSGQRGLAYTVSAEIEVVPPYDSGQVTSDNAIITAYNTANGYVP